MQNNKKFKDYSINKNILKALDELKFTEPTEVQEKTLEHSLAGKDIIVNAKTGSGKTAAFAIPIINSIKDKTGNPKALILAPTRELAIQVANEIKKIAKYNSLRTLCVYGKHSILTEITELEKGVDILVGTPGRVIDHIENEHFNRDEICFFVLDEADRMLDMGFIKQVEKILFSLKRKRQTMLFSATIPLEIMNICHGYMNSPVEIKIKSPTLTVDLIEQSYYRVSKNKKRELLCKLIKIKKPKSLIVFCNTRWQVDRTVMHLNRARINSNALHGGVSQSAREKTMNLFKNSKIKVLVATDVAARGIHIDDLEMVVNLEIPDDKDNYVHRIGRTGRIGKKGQAINLVDENEIYSLYEIEEHVGTMIREEEIPSREELRKAIKYNKDNREKSYKKPSQKNQKGNLNFKVSAKVMDEVKIKTKARDNSNYISDKRKAEILYNIKNKKKKQRKSFLTRLKAIFKK